LLVSLNELQRFSRCWRVESFVTAATAITAILERTLKSATESALVWWRTGFSQVIEVIQWRALYPTVDRCSGDDALRELNWFDQFRAMACAQLTRRWVLSGVHRLLGIDGGASGMRALVDCDEGFESTIRRDSQEFPVSVTRPTHLLHRASFE